MDVFRIIANASNIRTGGNPKYCAEDFFRAYPQFAPRREEGDEVDNMQIKEIVPAYIVDAWIKIAQSSIHKNRYHELWEMAMGYFIAHWLTLHLQTQARPDAQAGEIINAGLAKGLLTSKSVGDVSAGYDFNQIGQDFAGWGAYKQTAYGQQFITLAKTVSMRGMVVW